MMFKKSLLIIITFLVILIASSCALEDDLLPDGKTEEINLAGQGKPALELIASVAKEAIKESKAIKTKKSLIKLTDIENEQVRYEFDTIEIVYAFEFAVLSSNEINSPIDDICGVGDLNIIIANFKLYKEDESFALEETLICITGEIASYVCLLNGWTAQYNDYLENYRFSTHKYLDGTDVIKDKTEDYYEIAVVRYKDTSIYYMQIKDKVFAMIDDTLYETNENLAYIYNLI